MSNASRRGPRPLAEILGDLFTVRGYSRLLARQELEDVWNATLGEPYCRQTRLGEVRRGVLNVTVAYSTLLEELAAFRKSALLQALRACAPAMTIHDIRFRVGPVRLQVEDPQVMSPGTQAGEGKAKLTCLSVQPRHRGQARRRKSSRSSGSNPVEP
jgi:Dna[CI] antecedent, DciA